MSDELVRVEHLKKYYNGRAGLFSGRQAEVRAVDSISLSIRRGMTVGLVGESGCGKSTAGKTILNLIQPTGGRVLYDGTVLFDVENKEFLSTDGMTALRRKMQIIFQDPLLLSKSQEKRGADHQRGHQKAPALPKRGNQGQVHRHNGKVRPWQDTDDALPT